MPKRILKGVVVSGKMHKTVVVSVTNVKAHPKYKKRVRITKKYKAHCAGFDLKIGDIVVIEECRPISKDKTWVIKEVLKRLDLNMPTGEAIEDGGMN